MSDLAERLASIIQQRATNAQMRALGLSVGLTIPPYEGGVSKRDRARQALAGKSPRELGEIARQLGVRLGDYGLEETGLAVLEDGSAPSTEITRRDVARCFGDDLCGEQDVVTLVGRLFGTRPRLRTLFRPEFGARIRRIDQIGMETEDKFALPCRLRRLWAPGAQAPTSYILEAVQSVVGEGFEMASPEMPDWPVVLKTVPWRMVRSFGEKCVLQAL